MVWLLYRGNMARVVAGSETGTQYACSPRSFIEVEDADAPQLLRMPKARCGCGRMFRRQKPR